MIEETEASSCLAFALNHATGDHTFESHADLLTLHRKATNLSNDSLLLELIQ